MARGINIKPIWNKITKPLRITRRGTPQYSKRVNTLPDVWNRRYSVRRCQAKFRREEWAFTPETYMKVWLDSGRDKQCGRGPEDYCMVRIDATEAWGPHNTMIVQRKKQLTKLIFDNTHHRRTGQAPQDWSKEEAECWTGDQE